jgi:hypothetical protein
MKDFFRGVGILLTIPAAMFSSEEWIANSYVVNGVLGGVSFALVAFFWQFVVKNQEKQ